MRLIRIVSLAAAAAMALSSPAFAEPCLPYAKTHTKLVGQVYAFEAFDEAEGDTVMRTRDEDYYALVLGERVCVASEGPKAPPAEPNVTIVQLKGPVAKLKAMLRQPVEVSGRLSRGRDGRDHTPVVLKVRSLQPLNASK